MERRRKAFHPEFLAQLETTLAVANGYLGMRGGSRRAAPTPHGTFINGFYETWPIPYGEKAFGFAKTGQTMVNVPDGKIIRLTSTTSRSRWTAANLLELRARAGHEGRARSTSASLWETPAGKQVSIKLARLVSFTERHVAAIWYEVTVLNGRRPASWSCRRW